MRKLPQAISMPIGTTHLKPKLMLYEDATLALSKT